MSQTPSETWRLSVWLKIDQAASLAANIDPQTPAAELTDHQKKEIEILRKAIWQTARVQNDDVGVRISYVRNQYGEEDYEDEDDSQVSAEWLKELLSSKGFTTGFFFPSSTSPLEAFMDPNHDHFSPELALAVTVWRAFEGTSVTKRSPRQAVIAWLEDNPDAWRGDDLIKNEAVERVATLVNWAKKGGAPKSGG